MQTIPILLIFLGHVWVDASQAVLSVGLASGLILGLGFGTGGLGTAFSGFLADRLGLYQVLWILALAPVLGAVLVAFIRTGGSAKQTS